jgi:hypothetical protein
MTAKRPINENPAGVRCAPRSGLFRWREMMRTRARASIGRLLVIGVCAALLSACGPRAGLDAGNAGAAGSSGGAAGSLGSPGGSSGASAGGAGSSAGGGGSAGAIAGVTGQDAASGGDDAGFEAGAAGASASDGGTDAIEDTGMAPANHSGGCGMDPAPQDSSTKFTQKILMVSGIDPAFIARFPVNAGSVFNWTKRNYYVRLPVNYDRTKAYPVDMEGTGCAGGETTGSSGQYALPATVNQTESIQIGLSYVTSRAANPDCLAFADDFPGSPETAYLHGVIAEIESRYCVDTNRIFVNGYETGAWEAELAGCTNADEVRAFGIQIGGGLHRNRPTCETHPVAAMFVVGLLDQGNPIGPLAMPQNDTIGSVATRDELLHRNGCVAPDFQIVDTCPMGIMMAAGETGNPCTPGVINGDTYGNVPHQTWDPAFPKCQTYTGCPAEFPVVWCPLLVNHGNGPNPMGADGGVTIENYRRAGLWKFFSTLPAL